MDLQYPEPTQPPTMTSEATHARGRLQSMTAGAEMDELVRVAMKALGRPTDHLATLSTNEDAVRDLHQALCQCSAVTTSYDRAGGVRVHATTERHEFIAPGATMQVAMCRALIMVHHDVDPYDPYHGMPHRQRERRREPVAAPAPAPVARGMCGNCNHHSDHHDNGACDIATCSCLAFVARGEP